MKLTRVWLNVHEHCLHMWETKDRALEDQWRAERRGHVPTDGAAA